jgi:hypothetical protein
MKILASPDFGAEVYGVLTMFGGLVALVIVVLTAWICRRQHEKGKETDGPPDN